MRTLHIGGTAHGTLPAIVDPADGITPVAPSALAALVIKNGSDTADSVTITADGTRIGVYRWAYNPASEVEGDQFSIVFTITVAGNPYYHTEDLTVIAVERGTDGANTTAPPTAAANAAAVRSELTTELARIDIAIGTRQSETDAASRIATVMKTGVEYRYTASDDGEFYDVTISESP